MSDNLKTLQSIAKSMDNPVIQWAAAEIARLREERRWVSVEERLPEIGVGVLAIDDDGIAVHWWDRHRWCSKKACHTCPTHWQPLPPGPEGDG